jgi:hypothetical protein
MTTSTRSGNTSYDRAEAHLTRLGLHSAWPFDGGVVSDGYRGICTRTKLPRDAELRRTHYSNPK